MQKIFRALLMLTCAFLVVICSGCEKKNSDANEITVRIYDAENDCDIDSNVAINEEINLNSIVNIYLKTYGLLRSGNSEDAFLSIIDDIPEIESAIDGDVCVLTFSDALSNMGAQSESEFIDNLAYTIRTNMDGIKGIRININGEEYASGHLYYELDELIVGE